MALVVSQLAKGLTFIGKPVHETLFPFPIASTIHAARISIAYQVNSRAAERSTKTKMSWPAYIAGYLVMTWGGTIITHHLMQLPPPMLYSTTPYIIYITTHLVLTLFFTLFPSLLLSPSFLALLDTALVPLDALVRTVAVTGATSNLYSPSSTVISKHLTRSPLTYLIVGAFASSGGGLLASTLSTWSPNWSLGTPPVLRAPAFFWASVDIWGGALVAAVHATLVGAPAFFDVQQTLVRHRHRGFVVDVLGIRCMEEDGCAVGTSWVSDLDARAIAAGALMVCFAMRVYKLHWTSTTAPPMAVKEKSKTS